MNHFFSEMPQRPFLLKMEWCFSFMEFLSKTFEDPCSIIIKSFNMDMVALRTGIVNFLEFPITTVKPSLERLIGLYTLIHSIVCTYLAEDTEPHNVQYQDMTQMKTSFEVNQFDPYKDRNTWKNCLKINFTSISTFSTLTKTYNLWRNFIFNFRSWWFWVC